jgi:hypothetical protein
MDTIDRIVEQDKNIYTAILTTITPMNNGDNISLDDLTRKVSKVVNMDTDVLKPFVSHFAHSVEVDGLGYVAPGRFGGFRRGARPTSKRSSCQ